MIFSWFENNDYRNFEKLLGAIYDLGIASRKQLLAVSNFSVQSLDRTLHELNKKELITIESLSDHRSIYRLSQKGILYAQNLTGNYSAKTAPESQIGHFLGLNNILERLIENFGRDFEWYNTKEAADYLFTLRLSKVGGNETELQKTYIRPDAFLKIENQNFWIEFDNSTETSIQLLKKYRLYIANIARLEDFKNVIWVTKDVKRRNFLNRVWKDYGNDVIKMNFFSASEEIAYMKRQIQKKSKTQQENDDLSSMIELT